MAAAVPLSKPRVIAPCRTPPARQSFLATVDDTGGRGRSRDIGREPMVWSTPRFKTFKAKSLETPNVLTRISERLDIVDYTVMTTIMDYSRLNVFH